MIGRLGDRRHAGNQPAAADRGDEGVDRGHVLQHFLGGGAGAGDDPRIIERMDEGVAALRLQLTRMGISGIEGVAVQHHVGAVTFRLRHLYGGRVGGHHDHGFDAEPVGVIGEALRMIARRRRDHALGARRLVELEQRVERAAFLIGGGELQILELEIDRRAGHFRKRAADQRWRSDDGVANALVRGADVVDRDGKGGLRGGGLRSHDALPPRPSGVAGKHALCAWRMAVSVSSEGGARGALMARALAGVRPA